MKEYRCPYCGKNSYSKTSNNSGPFKDWDAVRKHTAKCNKNTKKYYVDSFYGPIHYNELLKDDWRITYPKLNNIDYLRKRFIAFGFRYEEKWNKNNIILAIQEFFNKNGRVPAARDFQKNDYPCKNTLRRHFGTFNKAIEAAGFEPNIQNGFGTDTYGLDGHLYRSQAEARFADNFLFGKYQYTVEPKYPKPYNRYYDWYIIDLDLYIELDGGLRPERIKEKIELNNQLGRNLLVIPTNKLQDVAPLSQQAEEEDLKSFQCRFESDRGYE